MKILSWNTGLTERVKFEQEIYRYVKEFLEQPDSAAVLQQIPLLDPQCGWEVHTAYRDLLSLFPKESYCLLQNNTYNRGRIIMETVLLTKMQGVRALDPSYYPGKTATNREIAAELPGGLTLLGLHARTGRDNVLYLRSVVGKADVIMGDFNAGDYPESENRELFRTLLPDHVCLLNLPTRRVTGPAREASRESCIDHVFVKRELVTRCTEVKVDRRTDYSDHYPVLLKIDL